MSNASPRPGTLRILDHPQTALTHHLAAASRCAEPREEWTPTLDQWTYANKVTLDFSRPGKPTDNAFIESFNARVRAECLNENWFLSLDDAKTKVEAWRQDYNNHRPHSSLSNLAPREFAESRQAIPDR